MAFVHEQSCECTKSELDLFSVPATQTSIETGSWIEYHPLTSLADGSPIEFEINGSGEDYIDFANSYLNVRAKITNADGSNIANDAVVGPTNLFLHSLFSQVDVALNGTQITPSMNTYPYRAMIETLLSYGGDAKESQFRILSAVLYIRKVKLSPSVFLANAKVLERANVKYPIHRVICKTFTIPNGYYFGAITVASSCWAMQHSTEQITATHSISIISI